MCMMCFSSLTTVMMAMVVMMMAMTMKGVLGNGFDGGQTAEQIRKTE